MPPQGSYGAPGPSYPPAPQPTLPPQQSNSNDSGRYDFFMAPPPPKKTLLPNNLSGGSFTRRLVLIGGAFVGIMILLILITLFLPKGGSIQNLIAVTQAQNELIRIATGGTTRAKDQDVLNLSANIQMSVLTEQQQLLVLLAKHGTKVSAKQLALTKSATTDQTLTAAAAASNYDPAITTVLQTDLTTYSKALKTAFGTTKLSDERLLLSAQYSAAQLLLVQANTAASNGNDVDQ